ncbi:YraN family protein, partial [Streptomyces sp. NPDC058861]|uniref:YraN family protein n=1 Tax=Streptomyces sp. NPDC058861 TaxID=3346653 RepID=UPI00368F3E53
MNTTDTADTADTTGATGTTARTGATRALGRYGEELAARRLTATGMRVLARNWRCGRTGEIDIVAHDKRDELHWMQHSSRRQHGRSCRSQACCRISGR